MKKRQLFAVILTAALTASVIGACGSAPAAPAAPAPAETEAEETAEPAADDAAAAEAEPDTVVDADDELAAIQEAGKLIVGIEGTYPPFTFHNDTGDLLGYDVEVAENIAAKLGVEVEFVEAAWDSLLIGVDTGRFDTVINCVSITDERKEKYDFSDPYYFTARQIVVRGDDDSIQSEDDLKGKKIATNLTNAYIDWYESHGAEVVGIDTSGEAAEMLLSGRVDFTSFSEVILADYLNEHPDADLKVAFVIPNSEAEVGIPIRKGETRLLEAINSALQEMREDGTLVSISEKYFNGDYTRSQFE